MLPLISIIIPTYNRAGTIGRTIDSILIQSYKNLEIVVVDDGSTDETVAYLSSYSDKRLRIIKHAKNMKTAAAINTGLDHVLGDWFTLLGSDDEILPDALETMIKVPLERDNSVTAVSCNCMDTGTGQFSGKGLNSDQYVDHKQLATVCSGEFWGITRTELLNGDRLNQHLRGTENTLWFKVNERAKRFYIHRALRLYHTEGDDRMGKAKYSIEQIAAHYESLMKESHYLETIKENTPTLFVRTCLRAVVILVANNQTKAARFYYDYALKARVPIFSKIVLSCIFAIKPGFLRFIIKVRTRFK